MNGKTVYTLESTYKDNDSETLGAYTSPRALAVGLALTDLATGGRCQVDLDDGCCVSCVLYHDDAKNVKE